MCLVNSRDAAGEGLDRMEKAVAALFESEKGFIDATSPSVRFQLASVIGRVAGAEQCDTVYSLCKAQYKDMAKFVEDGFGGSANLVQ